MSTKKKDTRSKASAALKRDAAMAGMTVEQLKAWRSKERLKVWTREHRKDPAYRQKERDKQNARMEALRADAELGRIVREFLTKFGQMMIAIGQNPFSPSARTAPADQQKPQGDQTR